jgi:hypothetical protein
MIRLSGSVASLLLLLVACSGGSEVSTRPAEDASATAAPTTTTETTAPLTPVTPEPTVADPAVERLAARLPVVNGFTHGATTPVSWWKFGEDVTAVSRSLEADGSWVGEVSIVDAGEATADAWARYVNDHHVELDVLGAQPDASRPEDLTVWYLGVPVWDTIGHELVLSTSIDGAWTGMWYHDGLVWSVSGLNDSRAYAEGVIDQQAEPEPEQTDIDVLEGPRVDAAVEVPGFVYIDPPHSEVLLALADFGECADHVSLHGVNSAAEPVSYYDADLSLAMVVYSGLGDCNAGRDVLADVLADPTMEPTEIHGIPAAISNDQSYMVWVGEDGVIVDVAAPDAAALENSRPFLEAIAAHANS